MNSKSRRRTLYPLTRGRALVRPSAAMLENATGRDYLRIGAELIADPANIRRAWVLSTSTELDRWDSLAKRHMAETTLPLHRRFSAMNLCFSELGRRAASRRRGDHRLFVSDLVDLVTGLLSTEVSEENASPARRAGAPRAVRREVRRPEPTEPVQTASDHSAVWLSGNRNQGLVADGPQPPQGSLCAPSSTCTGHGPGCRRAMSGFAFATAIQGLSNQPGLSSTPAKTRWKFPDQKAVHVSSASPARLSSKRPIGLRPPSAWG